MLAGDGHQIVDGGLGLVEIAMEFHEGTIAQLKRDINVIIWLLENFRDHHPREVERGARHLTDSNFFRTSRDQLQFKSCDNEGFLGFVRVLLFTTKQAIHGSLANESSAQTKAQNPPALFRDAWMSSQLERTKLDLAHFEIKESDS
jgi:hypothetical protein